MIFDGQKSKIFLSVVLFLAVSRKYRTVKQWRSSSPFALLEQGLAKKTSHHYCTRCASSVMIRNFHFANGSILWWCWHGGWQFNHLPLCTICWLVPLPSHNHHQDHYIFSNLGISVNPHFHSYPGTGGQPKPYCEEASILLHGMPSTSLGEPQGMDRLPISLTSWRNLWHLMETIGNLWIKTQLQPQHV